MVIERRRRGVIPDEEQDANCSDIAFMGVDPGAKGAAALLIGNDILFIDWNKSESYLAGLIRGWHEKYKIEICLLELVHSMPKQGVKSMFSFGTNFGIWRGILATLGIRTILESPQTWMKNLVSGEGSMPVAQRLFPNAPLLGPRGGELDGRSDSLLMAYVARRRHLAGI